MIEKTSSDFVEVYDQALDRELCIDIINAFERSPFIEPGRTGGGIDLTKKISDDVTISRHHEWLPIVNTLLSALLPNLCAYANKYPALLTSSVTPTVRHPIDGRPVAVTIENYDECGRVYVNDIVKTLYRVGEINVQRYRKGIGGYPFWHSEIYPGQKSANALSRVLLFQFFLNDIAEGGEMEFLFQTRQVPARAGSLVIAPAGFTHTHRGCTPQSTDKYIVTSWILFSRLEE